MNEPLVNNKWVDPRYIKRGASATYHNPLDHKTRKWFYNLIKERGITSVLDVGCGQGQDAYPIMNTNAKYIGIDPIVKNIARARKRWKSAEFQCGYIQELDFADDSFDCIWMMSVWENIPHATMKIGIEECCRVAKKYVITVDAGYPPGHFKKRQSYVPTGWTVAHIRMKDEAKDKYFTIWIIERQQTRN